MSLTMRHLSIVETSPLSTPRPRVGAPDLSGTPQPNALEDLSDRLRTLGKDASVEQAIEIGRLVVETLYAGDLGAWHSRGPKAHSLRSLARRNDLPVSSSALYRSVALYELSVSLGGIERWTKAGLGISHLRLVLGLAKPEQRRLLDEAVAKGWNVAELEREAVRVRRRGDARPSRGGRPRLPRFVKSVNRLRKAAEAPDELFGDLDAAADMTPERLAEIRDILSTIRVRCAELDRALERVADTHHPA